MKSLLLFLLLLTCASAFPPAPPHQIYGMVRMPDGEPVSVANALIILETSEGITVSDKVVPGLEGGVNYRLSIPMDDGLIAEPYLPNALQEMVPFTIKVRIGSTDYVPLEMLGDPRNLGKPGDKTKINLTLGIDSDGDGLPDSWEQALIALLGGDLGLADIRPGDDSDGDGMSNYDEYIAGTYAFDANDRFALGIHARSIDCTTLDFLAIKGRSYSVEVSTNKIDWVAADFRVPADGAGLKSTFQATQVRRLEIEVPCDPEDGARYFFRGCVK